MTHEHTTSSTLAQNPLSQVGHAWMWYTKAYTVDAIHAKNCINNIK